MERRADLPGSAPARHCRHAGNTTWLGRSDTVERYNRRRREGSRDVGREGGRERETEREGGGACMRSEHHCVHVSIAVSEYCRIRILTGLVGPLSAGI